METGERQAVTDDNAAFDAALNEILDPGPEKVVHHSPARIQPTIFAAAPETHRGFSPTVGILIRIIAAVALVVLLVGFGMQIAFR